MATDHRPGPVRRPPDPADLPSDLLRERILAVADREPVLPELPEDTRLAAVLIPILAAGAAPRLVLTRRADHLSRHPGEISFPGGLADDGEHLAAAALREAEEELGLAPTDVELLGTTTAVHTHVTGILVVPFVGMLWSDPAYTPNAGEIAEVLEFPLADLARAHREEEWEWEGRRFMTNVYAMDEDSVIWGATARILALFLDRLRGATGLEVILPS
jgi:8-oxo-dGTP pyrophosphatase MutT (NUDIX family)